MTNDIPLLSVLHVYRYMSTVLLFLPQPSHTHALTEAVVLYDREKEDDDELSGEMGDVITDVEKVCVVSGSYFKTTMYGATSCIKVSSSIINRFTFQLSYSMSILSASHTSQPTHLTMSLPTV